MFATGTEPRAALLTSADVDVWFSPEFSGRDICTAMWVTGTGKDDNRNNSSRIYLASVYLDITVPVEDMFPRGWKELVTHCTRYRVPLIACMDTNAHSILWGTESNARGEALENYLFTHFLKLENVGCCPTFVARGTQMCIGVTISLNLSPLMIEGWEVSKATTMSDHRRIKFCLLLNSNQRELMPLLGLSIGMNSPMHSGASK